MCFCVCVDEGVTKTLGSFTHAVQQPLFVVALIWNRTNTDWYSDLCKCVYKEKLHSLWFSLTDVHHHHVNRSRLQPPLLIPIWSLKCNSPSWTRKPGPPDLPFCWFKVDRTLYAQIIESRYRFSAQCSSTVISNDSIPNFSSNKNVQLLLKLWSEALLANTTLSLSEFLLMFQQNIVTRHDH